MIPRRMLGFGFALFLMMVILALIYSQYAAQKMGGSVDTTTGMNKKTTPVESVKPLPATVTPDAAVDDLIDEALADSEDMTTLTADEIADMEEGN